MYHGHFTVACSIPRNSVQKCIDTSTIFDYTMSANRFARLLMKKTCHSPFLSYRYFSTWILSVCLFALSFSFHSKIFHSFGDVTITGGGLQILPMFDTYGFFSVAHLLWHGPILYNGHLRGPVTLTPVAKRVAVQLSLPVFDDSRLSRPGIEPRSPACEFQ